MLDLAVRGVGSLYLGVSVGQIPGEALHLTGEKILRNRSRIVGAEELLPFVLHLLLALGGSLESTAGFGLLVAQFVTDCLLDLSGVVRCELEVTVEIEDGILNLLDTNGSPATVVLLGLTFHAPEVGVGTAVAFLFGIDQTAAAR